MAFDKDDYKGEVSERQLEELFKEATRHGAVLALLHFDAHGPEKKAVEDSMVDFLSRLANERGVLYCKGEVEKAVERQGMYSSCSEVKMLANTFSAMLDVSLKYGPVAIEILAPEKFVLDLEEAQSLLLDASQSSQDYVQYILDNTLNPSERQKLQEKLRQRVEFGKQLAEDGKATTSAHRED